MVDTLIFVDEGGEFVAIVHDHCTASTADAGVPHTNPGTKHQGDFPPTRRRIKGTDRQERYLALGCFGRIKYATGDRAAASHHVEAA